VTRNPAPPAAGTDLVITALVRPTYHPVAQVTMYYRVMFGGEVTVAMRDDGTAGDAVAGDRFYTAVIPAPPISRVRWFVGT